MTEGSLAGKEFRESDPREAVRRFGEMTATAPPPSVAMPAAQSFATLEEMFQAIGNGKAPAGFGNWAVGADGRFRWVATAARSAFYALMAEELSTQIGREKAARETGLGWLQWGPELTKPVTVKLEDLLEAYTKKPGLAAHEAAKSRLFWGEFQKWSGASTLAEITHPAVVQYEAKLREPISPPNRSSTVSAR